ncbi:MAG: ROK family protein [Bacilli bacterium]|nr:ROK family protein [Bacilli bacterium]
MSKKIVALDIGGTNTRVALVNERFEIENVLIKPTKVGNLDLFMKSVIEVIREAVPDMSEVICIAGGVPGRVRWDGYIYALPNIHISQIPLAETLEKEFGKKTYIINDAEVAALAEANLGEYSKYKSLYFITISTGVGGALTIDGKLRSSSYEIGHTMTQYKNEIHEFEHMCSGTGLRRLADDNGLNIADAREFFTLVKNGHELANRVYRDWIRLLANFISMIQEHFQPEVFTITGGVMKSADIFWEDLVRNCPYSKLLKANAGQNAGLLGAAVYGFQMAE